MDHVIEFSYDEDIWFLLCHVSTLENGLEIISRSHRQSNEIASLTPNYRIRKFGTNEIIWCEDLEKINWAKEGF